MPFDNEQLNRLIGRVASGDPSALDKIFALCGKRMFALARGIVKTREDAEDVVSESFVKLARFAASFRAGTNGYGFLMRIVRNTALDFLRKNHRTATENIDDFFTLADERYSPERREEALFFEEAMRGLPLLEKKMIYYRYFLGFTVREIAAETGMSKSAVQRATDHAESLVKKYLQAGQNGEE